MKRLRTLTQCALTMVALIAQQQSMSAQTPAPNGGEGPSTINILPAPIELQPPKIDPSEQKIVDLLKSKDYPNARKLLQSNLKQLRDKDEKAEQLELLAFTDAQAGKTKSAISTLKSLSVNSDACGLISVRSRAVVFKRIGDLYLAVRKNKDAIAAYKQALSLTEGMDSKDVCRADVLEPLVGSILADEDYNEAQPYAEQLQSVCQERAKSGQLIDVGSLFWADFELLQIYKHIHTELHAKLMAQTMPLLDQLLALRVKYAGHSPEEEAVSTQKVHVAMLHAYISEHSPSTLADYLWLGSEFRMRYLPLITWAPPSIATKAVILCVHGLGLENRAFSPFAREMADKNFLVYAMDVRGFGAWMSEYGTETVSFDRTLSDVRAVISLLHHKHPGLPVFLLGESMGGAIALRAASEFGDDMAGVISSVPSAARYGSGKMDALVAVHLFRNPNKPFNIAPEVADKATSKEALREIWMDDPKAKTELSPVELIKFNRFMNVTQKRCSLIRSTPVMVVQGMADKLVKPKGTYEMYDNVKSPDKTMIVIGSAEHLIFETPKQSQVLLDGLAAWINNHLTTTASQPVSAAQ